jgi:hypothetical protein
MGLTQDFVGLVEPADRAAFDRAPSSLRKAYYDAAGQAVLQHLTKQLSRGVGRDGRKMRVRKRAVLADGADGPVMEPHYERSRVITLADYMATDHGLKLFWHAGTGHRTYRAAKKRGKTPAKFGEILGYHADGEVPHAPVRDVRLSKANTQQVRLDMRAWWARHAPKPEPARPAPRPAPIPAPKPKARPAAASPLRDVPLTTKLPARIKKPTLFDLAAIRGDRKGKGKGPPPPAPLPAPAPKRPARPKPAPAIAASPTITIAHEGLTFKPSYQAEQGYETILADVRALAAELAKQPEHVGPGGTGQAKPGAYTGAKAFIAQARQSGAAIEIPRVGLTQSGEPTVIDGRHRLAVFAEEGYRFLPVSVPAASSAAFRGRFGALAP